MKWNMTSFLGCTHNIKIYIVHSKVQVFFNFFVFISSGPFHFKLMSFVLCTPCAVIFAARKAFLFVNLFISPMLCVCTFFRSPLHSTYYYNIIVIMMDVSGFNSFPLLKQCPYVHNLSAAPQNSCGQFRILYARVLKVCPCTRVVWMHVYICILSTTAIVHV